MLKSGRFTDIDLEHLIDEIESMGRSEKRELDSWLSVLLAHLLKWQYQPSHRGNSWHLTIEAQRDNFRELLKDNTSLKPQLETIVIHAYKQARIHAAQETGIDKIVFPDVMPWTFAQLLDDEFYPEALGIS